MAYCMLGLFDVYMPPLYGEGQNAFQRLQLEILKASDDESIFAWKSSPEDALRDPYRGLLAQSVSEFRMCGGVRPHHTREIPPYSMTNKGIGIIIPLAPRGYSKFRSIYKGEHRAATIFVAKLNCWDSEGDNTTAVDQIGIFVMKPEYFKTNSFSRVFPYRHSTNIRFYRPSAFLGEHSEEPVSMRNSRIYISDGQTLYFKSQLSLSSPQASKFRDFQLIGAELQSYLSEIITIEKREHWVEYEPFKFLQHAIDEDWPTAIILRLKKRQHEFYGALEGHIVILFFHQGGIPVTKIDTASNEIIRSWELLQKFLNDAMAKDETIKDPPSNLKLPSPWLQTGWSVLIPAWNQVLKLELSDPLSYTLSLLDEEKIALKPLVPAF